jgi:hypothetical protein
MQAGNIKYKHCNNIAMKKFPPVLSSREIYNISNSSNLSYTDNYSLKKLALTFTHMASSAFQREQ